MDTHPHNLYQPVAPRLHHLVRQHTRHAIVSYCVAGAAIVVAIVCAVMWHANSSGRYEPIFEGLPGKPTEVLQCAGDPRTYWAQTGQQGVSQCIFSGDMSLPDGVGVSEKEVREICDNRLDCGGYSVRVSSTYAACNTNSACEGCVKASYNHGQPEYMLYSHRAMQDIRQVSGIVQGSNNEVRTTTYRRA